MRIHPTPLAFALLLAGAAAPALAQGHDHGAASAPAAAATAAPSHGEVRKIDRAGGQVTLRHGPLQNLDMPGMTMVFKVADPSRLDGLKEGDQVDFRAEMVNGALTVTSLAPTATASPPQAPQAPLAPAVPPAAQPREERL